MSGIRLDERDDVELGDWVRQDDDDVTLEMAALDDESSMIIDVPIEGVAPGT